MVQSKYVASLPIQGTIPTITNGVKNINRYQNIRAFFQKDNAYRIFAEPFPDLTGQSITWQTDWDYEGTPRLLNTYSEAEQTDHRRMIKKQAMQLYFRAVILQKEQPDMPVYKDLKQILHDCLEIPSDARANIFVLQVPGQPDPVKYVVTQWGHLEDVINPRRRIIEKWLRSFDVVLRVRYVSGATATGENFKIQYDKITGGRQAEERRVDEESLITLADVKLDSPIHMEWKHETAWEHILSHDGKEEYFVTLPDPVVVVPEPVERTIRFLCVDKRKNPVPGVAINFTYNKQTFQRITDAQGQIEWRGFPFFEKDMRYRGSKEKLSYNRKVKITGKEDAYTLYPTNRWWLWWLLGLLALLLLVLFLKNCSGDIMLLTKRHTLTVKDDSTKAVLAGVKVEIITQTDTIQKVTDEDGEVELAPVEGSQMDLGLEKEGYGDKGFGIKPGSDTDTTVFMRRLPKLREMKGETGDIRINLQWETRDDLDLHLLMPDGRELFFGKPSYENVEFSVSLDVDANASGRARSEGLSGFLDQFLTQRQRQVSPITDTPQENINANRPMPGTYSVKVVNYEPRTSKTVEYTVYIKIGNNEQVLQGKIKSVAGTSQQVKEFVIPAL
ncbi:hypothetical protein [Dyadobacter diqingensis]|uniref:hypothetical protein n=1 Tax=Dyadobacter diqingensis TaxID=2938121 RepID=UPI0020C19837|nr:hypothetical protein [Dyadobacter diqingensis]